MSVFCSITSLIFCMLVDLSRRCCKLTSFVCSDVLVAVERVSAVCTCGEGVGEVICSVERRWSVVLGEFADDGGEASLGLGVMIPGRSAEVNAKRFDFFADSIPASPVSCPAATAKVDTKPPLALAVTAQPIFTADCVACSLAYIDWRARRSLVAGWLDTLVLVCVKVLLLVSKFELDVTLL